MYKDEPYGLFTYGYEEDLDKIRNKELYNAYLEMLKNSKIDIFVSGNFSEGKNNVDEIIKKQINEKNVQPINLFYIFLYLFYEALRLPLILPLIYFHYFFHGESVFHIIRRHKIIPGLIQIIPDVKPSHIVIIYGCRNLGCTLLLPCLI